MMLFLLGEVGDAVGSGNAGLDVSIASGFSISVIVAVILEFCASCKTKRRATLSSMPPKKGKTGNEGQQNVPEISDQHRLTDMVASVSNWGARNFPATEKTQSAGRSYDGLGFLNGRATKTPVDKDRSIAYCSGEGVGDELVVWSAHESVICTVGQQTLALIHIAGLTPWDQDQI